MNTQHANNTVLKVAGISKRCGGLQALSDVGMTIERGQVYGLIGPNGAGKTTFFNVITGLYTPDSGSYELAGKPYQPTAVHEVAQAGIAMGRPVLAPPGVDSAKVQILRDAMNAMFRDPEYLRECTQVARLKCETAWSGEEIAKFIAATYASPKDAVEKISEIFAQGQTP